jgi:hypothetical protein
MTVNKVEKHDMDKELEKLGKHVSAAAPFANSNAPPHNISRRSTAPDLYDVMAADPAATKILSFLNPNDALKYMHSDEKLRKESSGAFGRALLERVFANPMPKCKVTIATLQSYCRLQIQVENGQDYEPAPGLVRVRNRSSAPGLVRVRNRSSVTTYVSPGKTPCEYVFFVEDGKVYAGADPGFDYPSYNLFEHVPATSFPAVVWHKWSPRAPPKSFLVRDVQLNDLIHMEQIAMWSYVNDNFDTFQAANVGSAWDSVAEYIRNNRHQFQDVSVSLEDKLNPEFVRMWSELVREAIASAKGGVVLFGGYSGPRLFNTLMEAMDMKELYEETMVVEIIG